MSRSRLPRQTSTVNQVPLGSLTQRDNRHGAVCVECGSRIRHSNPRETTVSIKGGSLDEPVDLTSAVHIWTTRKLPGVVIPNGATEFPGEPD